VAKNQAPVILGEALTVILSEAKDPQLVLRATTQVKLQILRFAQSL
jgi:hypothetical protein